MVLLPDPMGPTRITVDKATLLDIYDRSLVINVDGVVKNLRCHKYK